MERNTRSPLCLMLEAVLFASGEPVPVSRLAQACEVSESAVQTALQQLAAWYEKQKSAICVQQLGDSWQMCTHPAYATVIQRAVETKKAAPLSAAAMEVLTIVAYNQPVSKSFVEHVRGVDSSSVVNTLVEKELLTEAGRLDVPGQAGRLCDNAPFSPVLRLAVAGRAAAAAGVGCAAGNGTGVGGT